MPFKQKLGQVLCAVFGRSPVLQQRRIFAQKTRIEQQPIAGALEDGTFEILIADIELPDMSGLELAAMARRRLPEYYFRHWPYRY